MSLLFCLCNYPNKTATKKRTKEKMQIRNKMIIRINPGFECRSETPNELCVFEQGI